MSESREPARPSGGFSLIELLLVVAVIAILAAISLPAISNYLRHYKIKGAAQQVAGEIQAARGKAINKNVNLGVVFLTIDETHYRWAVEDDQNPQSPNASDNWMTRVPVSTLIVDPLERAQSGPERALPIGIVFSQACAPPGTPSGGDWDPGMRFNRLGGLCNPTGTAEPCPDLGVGSDFVHNNSSESYVCVSQPDTGLTRWVQVRVGGRVQVQQ
jgi:prepilin-type N-terminal cleavage/methylation domain-containing protein